MPAKRVWRGGAARRPCDGDDRAVGVFFAVAINATTDVLGTDQIYLDVVRNYKASRWNMFWTIALPVRCR